MIMEIGSFVFWNEFSTVRGLTTTVIDKPKSLLEIEPRRLRGVFLEYFVRSTSHRRQRAQWMLLGAYCLLFRSKSVFFLQKKNPTDSFDTGLSWLYAGIICNGGRTKADLESQGTGTGLYLQNGTDPLANILHIDQDERKTLENTKWTFGKCFYTMGKRFFKLEWLLKKKAKQRVVWNIKLHYNQPELDGLVIEWEQY